MKNILTEALVNSATNASFIFSYTNSAKLRSDYGRGIGPLSFYLQTNVKNFNLILKQNVNCSIIQATH